MRRKWTVVVGLVRLVHPYPVVTVLLTSGVLIEVAHGGTPPLGNFIRAMCLVLSSQICVGSLNDYLDRDRDAVMQPDKPIPSGTVSPRMALLLSLLAGASLFPLGLSFGPIALLVGVIGLGSGVAYDLWLKPTPFSVMGYIGGFLSLVTWIFYAFGRLTPIFCAVYPVGSLLLVAAHLANALPDVRTDEEIGVRTLAVVLGPVRTYRIIFVCCGAVLIVGIVAAGVARAPASMALTLVSAALLAAAWYFTKEQPLSTASADRLFKIAAPAIGILAVGCLVALHSLSV